MARFWQGLTIILVFGVSTAAQPDEEKLKREPLVKQVGDAIDRGIAFLKSQQITDGPLRGSWENALGYNARPGGWTALTLLALLNAGVEPTDPVVERGLEWLRTFELPGRPGKLGEPPHTYVRALQTMVFAEAGQAKDKLIIQRNVDWLIRARVMVNGQLSGWTYDEKPSTADNSNTQYALLGLHAGKLAGAKIPEPIWREIRDFYARTQQEDGGWRYHNERGQQNTELTMTTAGLSGLLIAGEELAMGRQMLDFKTGIAANCGVYEESIPITKALAWLDGTHRAGRNAGEPRFAFENEHHTFYNFYGIERAGRLSGRRFLGGRDWYREGCKWLVTRQLENGSWVRQARGSTDSWPVISTSFALLFLSKGRTPLLISKLAHGPADDWNRKRADAKHLIEHASRELFARKPMAWQVYDSRKLDLPTAEARREEVGELLQSPIIYMTGHAAPQLTDTQKAVLKQYIEEGGFLMATSCCGSENFTNGFRELIKDLFPDNELRPLPPEHPIWRTHALVEPTEFDRLEGLEMGCKTVVIFSPQPLAGFWEENQSKNGRGMLAFRLAMNIIAYATGNEPPRPRLSNVELVDDKQDIRQLPRGFFQVGQLRHDGDWQPAPKAMRNLMLQAREKLRLEVDLKTEAVRVTDPDLIKFKFLYMHGRNEFDFDPQSLELLRANLLTGGTLFADACCGKEKFDKSFRAFVAKLFPKGKLEQIPLNDDLFSAELNGQPINSVRCRRERAGGGVEPQFQNVAPYLEGVKVNGRWVLIYSKYDIGCALERHASPDCKGHDPDSAARLGLAAVMYALRK